MAYSRIKKTFFPTVVVLLIMVGGYILSVILFYLKLPARALLCDQFITPTTSMVPTLIPGDRIIVDKTIIGPRFYSDFDFTGYPKELKSWRLRGRREVRVNDILVFNFPFHEDSLMFSINHVYAKRCVALPGDSISIVNGFYVNNNYVGTPGYLPAQQHLSMKPDSLFEWDGYNMYPYCEECAWSIKNMPPVYIPRKGDTIKITALEAALYRLHLQWELGCKIYVDRESGRIFAGNRELSEHTFQHNYYFMVGDNVENSSDSRFWGVVPEEYIVGVVSFISYSVDKQTGHYRWDRFLMNVKNESE